jgi:acyl carrier protein
LAGLIFNHNNGCHPLEGEILMVSKEEIFEKIQEALVDALGVDDDEVTEDATLVGDLGAESIDFLDIVFRLEKSFDISIPRGELFPEDILTNADYLEDGKITAEGVEELKKRMPFANLEGFEKNPVVQDFANLLTVADMVRFVEAKLDAAS